jgi:phage terminase large subunit-like protein
MQSISIGHPTVQAQPNGKSTWFHGYQDLRAQGCGWIYTLSPDRDKVTRLAHQAAKIEQGLVALPKQAPWLLPFEQEVAAFPYGKHDDQVDSMSQLLRALDYRKSLLMGLTEVALGGRPIVEWAQLRTLSTGLSAPRERA